MVGDEKLMAYVDGELPADERERIRAAIAQDESLQKAVAGEELLRRKLAELHSPVLEEDVPGRLTHLLESRQGSLPPLRGSSLAKSGPGAPTRWWKNVTAIAASLVLGLFLGQALSDPAGDESGPVAAVAQGQLAKALETQLASSQTPADPVQIGATFIGRGGHPCRTYETSASAGLACRSGGEWRLKLIAPGAGTPSTEYQQAGSSAELVMRSAQELLAEGPMGAEQERQARDAGWPGSTP